MAAKRRKFNQEGFGYQVFTVFNTIFLCLVILATAYPIYYILIASISDPNALMQNYGLIWVPQASFTFRAYQLVLDHPLILSGYMNTLFILIVGLAVNLSLTVLGAYFLTLKKALLHKPVAALILFSMYFSGGLVPMYLNVKSLGMIDSLWSLILPTAISTYNLLVLRASFAAIPDGLIEAASLDGAGHFKILTQVILPLCGASMAIMILYYGVGHWNAWFNASIFMLSPEKFPLQLILRQILILNQNTEMMASMDMGESAQLAELIKYALIVVSTAPILLLYPFLQRFFVKGVMVGSLKG